MGLITGARLGPYEVVAAVGAGGMGEVYRARDTRLNRDVALKVLPDAFVRDRERLARFEREAQLLAALSHPRIAAIYRLEEADGLSALVLEYVDGDTLAERLERGPMPLHEALPLAAQLADALAAAHDKGIIHRDLKPSNVKVCPDGTLKILDFGIAKALEPAAASREAVSQPTITTPAMTARGVVLGTAAYMSPEQARGLAVGKGADIWAFGCVFFEMLTGARAFGGADTTEILAAILRAEPDWTRLPAATPEPIRRLLRRCLEKDPARRLADIRDARFDLEETAAAPAPTATRRSARELALWAAAALLAVAAVAAFLIRPRATPVSPAREMRLEITAPVTTDPVSIALSPDGDKIALVASSNGRPQLWVRSLTTGALHALRDTDGASFPFWSPDSRSIGFFSGEKLYRIGLEGEVPRPIGHAPVGAGGAWGPDGTILFVMVPDAPLMRVAADGGAVSPLASNAPVSPAGPRTGERFPQFFPDGRHFLYYVAETHGVFLGRLDSLERRRLLDADAAAVPAARDRILFVRQGNLYEQRFDEGAQAMTGEATLVASNVPVDSRGAAALSASHSGTVIYRTGVSSQQRQLVWTGRAGKPLDPVDAPDFDLQWNPALSPDGRTVAMTRSVQGNTGVFLLDLERGVKRQLTFDAMPEIYPTWSPKGDYIAFAKPDRSGFFTVFVQSTTSRLDPVAHQTEAPAIPLDWSKDGRYLLCRSGSPQSGWRLVALDMENAGRILPLTDMKFEVKFGQFSPDTAWVTLESNESGHTEIFVQSFPAGEHKIQVSSGGGTQALWRADGRELFYIAADGYLMAVPVTSPPKASVIQFGTALRLFPTRIESTPQGGVSHQYAPAADGQKFLMNNFIEQTSAPIAVILNRGAGR